MTTATIDLPDVSQPFEWERGTSGLMVKQSIARKARILLMAHAFGEGVTVSLPTDDARKLAAYIWAAAAEADARAKP
jgi:hypothetical protein